MDAYHHQYDENAARTETVWIWPSTME